MIKPGDVLTFRHPQEDTANAIGSFLVGHRYRVLEVSKTGSTLVKVYNPQVGGWWLRAACFDRVGRSSKTRKLPEWWMFPSERI